MKRIIKNNTSKIIIIALFILFLIMTLPSIIASFYSVLVADDFSHANSVGAFNTNIISYLIASIKFTIDKYMNWQGTYFSMFIQALLSPINNFGLLQLKLVMIFNAILFWSSLIILLLTFLKHIDVSLYIKLIIVNLVVFSLSAYEVYEEIFTWFSGATSYSFPISLMMISFILYLNSNVASGKMGGVLF